MEKFYSLLMIFTVVACFCCRNWDKEKSSTINHDKKSTPTNVPLDAQWVGGIDGGDWIKCQCTSPEEMLFFCDIFAEVTGAPVASEVFEYSGPPMDCNNFSGIQMEYFDGSIISLGNGGELKEKNK